MENQNDELGYKLAELRVEILLKDKSSLAHSAFRSSSNILAGISSTDVRVIVNSV